MKKEVLILNYHNIDNGLNTDLSELDKIYSVRQSAFEKQINFIKKNDIPIVDVNDIVNNKIKHSFSIALSVDDGSDSDYSVVYPFLMDLQVKCTFFLISANVVNWAAIQEMHVNGFTIGSHGVNHADLTRLNKREIFYELLKSKIAIEEMIKANVNYFSFPFGMYNKYIISKGVELGYKAMFTTDARLNDPNKPNVILHRLSVKRCTSYKHFSELLTKRSALKRMIFVSSLKKTVRSILGSNSTNKLNLFLNSRKE